MLFSLIRYCRWCSLITLCDSVEYMLCKGSPEILPCSSISNCQWIFYAQDQKHTSPGWICVVDNAANRVSLFSVVVRSWAGKQLYPRLNPLCTTFLFKKRSFWCWQCCIMCTESSSPSPPCCKVMLLSFRELSFHSLIRAFISLLTAQSPIWTRIKCEPHRHPHPHFAKHRLITARVRLPRLHCLLYFVPGVIVVSWYPPDQADENGQPFDRLIPLLLDSAHRHEIKVSSGCFQVWRIGCLQVM